MGAYNFKKPNRSMLTSVPTYEGETIERKIERIIHNKEAITDGAPIIYTERKDGVVAAYNIRTDRWEVAAEAMDMAAKSIDAAREGKSGKMDVVHKKDKDGGAESTPSSEGDNSGSSKAE